MTLGQRRQTTPVQRETETGIECVQPTQSLEYLHGAQPRLVVVEATALAYVRSLDGSRQ